MNKNNNRISKKYLTSEHATRYSVPPQSGDRIGLWIETEKNSPNYEVKET